MNAADWQKIITEVGQILLALVALISYILLDINHIPEPDILVVILGGLLLALGVKIGIPLTTQPPAPPTAPEVKA